jgi:hypothetical protein
MCNTHGENEYVDRLVAFWVLTCTVSPVSHLATA